MFYLSTLVVLNVSRCPICLSLSSACLSVFLCFVFLQQPVQQGRAGSAAGWLPSSDERGPAAAAPVCSQGPRHAGHAAGPVRLLSVRQQAGAPHDRPCFTVMRCRWCTGVLLHANNSLLH